MHVARDESRGIGCEPPQPTVSGSGRGPIANGFLSRQFLVFRRVALSRDSRGRPQLSPGLAANHIGVMRSRQGSVFCWTASHETGEMEGWV